MKESFLRWFRYSLRTLLLLVTFGAAAFGLLGVKLRAAQRQQEAVAAIQKLGGGVAYDYQVDSVGNWDTNVSAPTPAWLRKIFGDDFFADVKNVYLCGCGATDETLGRICGLPRLESLNVSYTKITDAGLANLAGLTELRELRISTTGVTDAGVAHLQVLSQLETLFLDDTRVTDAGLCCLEGLKQLKNIILGNTQVTDDGCNRLMKTLPKMELYR